MYIPEVFKINDQDKIIDFMENQSFADLVTYHNQSLCSNKVPLILDKGKNVLYGHFGRSNPQLLDIEKSGDVLVIFSGPHSYISPRWYVSENMVPTWNFQTLQVKGTASLVDDSCLIEILEKLSARHESHQPNPWTMSELAPEKLDLMLKMIVGFKIDIHEINFKEKMSQNREIHDQQNLINSLIKTNDTNSVNVASIMRKNISG